MEAGRRRTEAERETIRRTTSIAIALGGHVQTGRRALLMTQHQLGEQARVSQSTISDIERGDGARTPLQTWVALGVALRRPLLVSFDRPLGAARDGLADAGHLEIQERVLALSKATGRHGTFELPTRPSDPSRSTDVGLRDPSDRIRILAECWNTIGDLGAAARATSRKAAEAAATWPDDRIATVWIVRATAANRALLARYPHILDAAFPGSSRSWVAALTRGVPPPDAPGLVWFDPATGRLTEHRRATMAR